MGDYQGCVYALDEKGQPDPLPNATLQLYSLPDTLFIQGGITDKKGRYYLGYNGEARRLLLRISYIGMETFQKELKAQRMDQYIQSMLGNKTVADSIVLQPKVLSMEEVKVVAELKKMYMTGDTLVYNTDAFKVGEGAVLMDLVRKMPGIYIKDGKLMYQNKPIQEIRLNGDAFFSNDLDIALQNMPAQELQQLKIYEDRTQEDKLMGTDSGNRQTVMDMKTKRDIGSVKFANVEAGSTTEKRHYLLRGDIEGYERNIGEYSLRGGLEDLPQMAASYVNRHAGLYVSRKLKELELSGNANYSFSKQTHETDARSATYMENYNLYSDSWSLSQNRQNGVSGLASLHGKVGKGLLYANASLSHSRGQQHSSDRSASFNQSPYELTDQPLWNSDIIDDTYKINSEERNSVAYTNNKQARFHSFYNRDWNENRHRLACIIEVNYQENEGEQFNLSTMRYYQLGDSIDRRREYVRTPDKETSASVTWDYEAQIMKAGHLKVGYSWRWNKRESERSLYNLRNLVDENAVLNTLPDNYVTAKSDSLSSLSDEHSHKHELEISFYTPLNKPLRLHIGSRFYLQKRSLSSERGSYAVDTTTTFLGFSPQANLTWTTQRNGKLSFRYNGDTEAPSTSQLLPVINNDNPLYIREGNPHLKPSYRQNFQLDYQSSMFTINASFSNELNSISSKTTYNELTGGRTVRPENINGNWSVNTGILFNKFWEDFALSTDVDYIHQNRVGYLEYTSSNQPSASKRRMKSNSVNAKLGLSYQWDRADVSLNQRFVYQHNNDGSTNRQTNTKDYTTQMEANYRFPFSLTLESDLTFNIRRGYALEEANHSELLWNLSAKYNFLKGKRASLKVEFFDLLRRQTNIHRSISAFGYSESNTHRLNSYGMITFAYRFNMMQ